MNLHRSRRSTWITLLVAIPLLGGRRLAAQDAPPPTPAQEQPEVLSRGPVHEAFAEPVNMQSQAGVMAPSQPPPSIEEVPPAERPQGEQFVWIPGYWSWDADRNGYIWVSACWRVAPPSRSWVPGYWARVPEGWEWVAGFWAPAGVQEIEYLPAPPATGDAGPPVPAPSPDTIWVPPCMYWVQGQYVRRPGYWLGAQPNWVWEPSHYIWTPRGYIFAEGHWDYSLERRGMLFAPVHFPPSVYGRSDLTYSPGIVLDLALLRVSLFAYPRYSHYYFGDYYDDTYLSFGIYPWFDSQRLSMWYDPIYSYDRWHNHRSEPGWEARERVEYNRRRADKTLRPARTYREQETRLAKLPEPQRLALQVAKPVAVAVASRQTPLKFERINADARQEIVKQATAVRKFRDDRKRWESTAASPKTAQPSPEYKAATVPPPVERQEVVRPAKERKTTATPPVEHAETIQSARERKVAAPSPEGQETTQPPKVRGGATPAPAERKETAVPPVAQREPAFAPPRQINVPQPARVRIPVSPVAGRSDAPGISQKGPPARPAGEDRDKEGRDIGRNKEADKDKDTRRD